MVVKLRPHQLRSIIFLTIHGVDFTLPHDCYGVINSWWDTEHSRVNYFVVNTRDGLLIKMFHWDYTPRFIERSLEFSKGKVNGKRIPDKANLFHWIDTEVPDLRATRWSEYHNSYRDFDVGRLFFVDLCSSFSIEEHKNYCLEVVSEIP